MSIVFPKNKGKRSRSSSTEANNSFVKNLTSRVSGLLPATITKWFSSPSSSATNGSAAVADTDSSTDDEAHDPITTQPPAKRIRYASDEPHINHYGLNDTNNINYTAEPSTSYSPVLGAPSRRVEPFHREPIYSTTPLRPTQDDPPDTADREGKTFRPQTTVAQITQATEKKRNSLFGSDSQWNQDTTMKSSVRSSSHTVQDPSQPCFKPALLSSPFYSGRTMYGGASSSYLNRSNVKLRKVAVVSDCGAVNNSVSHQARKVMELLEQYSSPLAEARRLPPRPSSDPPPLDTSLDPAANMLDRIKSYKTQELHVPSVASFLRIKQRSRLSHATSAARQLLASRSSTSDLRPAPPPTQPYPPRASEKESSSKFTTKVKSRLTRQNRGETNDANEMPTPVELPSGGLLLDGGKLPTFSLSSSVTSTPKPAAAPTAVITLNPAKRRPAPPAPAATAAEPFTFSSPIRIAHEPHEAGGPAQFTFPSPDRSVPTKRDLVDGSSKPPPAAAAAAAAAARDWTCDGCWVTNKPPAELCVCCGGAKPTPRPAPPAQPAKCSVCKFATSQSHVNKCVNCEKAQSKSPFKIGGTTQSCKPEAIPSLSNNLDKSSVDSSPAVKEWRCGDCWVMNKPASAKCVACGGGKPAAASSPQTPTSKAVPSKPLTNNIPKPDTSNDWRCDDCWVTNKHNLNTCVACGGARPGAAAKSAAVAFSGKFDYTGASQPAPPPKWECSSCLVRNDHNKTKCACCEADKPGAAPPPAPAAKFDFGVSPNMFKFGINHAKPTETPKPQTTAPEVKPVQETNKVESETNNNVVPKATFSFGVPSNKDKTAPAAATSKEETDPSSKVGFTFGIPAPKAQNADATPGKFSFSASIMKPPSTQPKLDTDKDKEQVVPKLPSEDVKTAKETPKATLNMFSSTFNTPASLEKTNTLTTFLVSSASSDKKEASSNPLMSNPVTSNPLTSNSLTSSPLSSNLLTSNPLTSNPLTSNPLICNPLTSNPLTSTSLTLAPATTSASSQPSPFGAGIKLNNMFASPAPTTSAVSFTLPAPAAAAAAADPAAPAPALVAASPLFGAPAAGSLFQKSDAPAAAPASAAAAPMFSHSGTTQADAKPKFNFTFGKTEPSAMFKPAFGAPDNKFPLASGGASAPEPAHLATLPASVFGAPKENMWTPQPAAPAAAAAAASNMFVTSTPTSATPKPTFSFGSSPSPAPSAFPAAGGSQAFGGAGAFGATATGTPPRPFGGAAPAFGAATNMFGMASPAAGANRQASLFSSPAPAANLFGSPPAPAPVSAAPAAGMFGSLAGSPAPAFGAPPPPSAPSLTPSATPSFNFGAQQQSPALFGFGQSAPPAAQPGVYNFGAAAGAAPVQFNMGSGMSPLGQPNTAVRKIRKATRRANMR